MSVSSAPVPAQTLAPPPTAITSTAARTLLDTFIHFLTVVTHTILYRRALYPPRTFLHTRAYNLPVYQSRHPAVCAWVSDALAAVRAQLVLGTVARVALVLHAPDAAVIERWMFDVDRFPAWGEAAEDGEGVVAEDAEVEEEIEEDDGGVNFTDVNEALRGALRRVSYQAEKMGALPEGCTYTIAVELKDEAPAPIGHPQPWIPAEANLQPPSKANPQPGSGIGGATTQPLRSVTAGPLWFECWLEEGHAKGGPPSLPTESSSRPPDTQLSL